MHVREISKVGVSLAPMVFSLERNSRKGHWRLLKLLLPTQLAFLKALLPPGVQAWLPWLLGARGWSFVRDAREKHPAGSLFQEHTPDPTQAWDVCFIRVLEGIAALSA